MDERRFRAVLEDITATIRDYDEETVFTAFALIVERFGYELISDRYPLSTRRITDKFWNKLDLDTLPGCWLWTGVIRRHGYGNIWWAGRNRTAHVFAYEMLRGLVPDGLELDHLCHTRDESCTAGDNCLHRRCVNPAHLEAVTPFENRRRVRNAQARQTHCIHGHEFTEENTGRALNGHRWCRACKRDRVQRYRSERKSQPVDAEDPGPCCCEYGDFYEQQGIMAPLHDCPAPAPLQEDELDEGLSDSDLRLIRDAFNLPADFKVIR